MGLAARCEVGDEVCGCVRVYDETQSYVNRYSGDTEIKSAAYVLYEGESREGSS